MVAPFLVLAFTASSANANPVYSTSWGSFSNPQALAVDQSNGNVFVLDVNAGTVSKYDSAGTPVDFTASQTYVSGNSLTGFSFDSPSAAQVAVDSSGGVANGDVYVTNYSGALDAGVHVFDAAGNDLGTLTGPGEACGVAVNQDGDVFVGYYSGEVDKYTPTANPVTALDQVASYTASSPCNVATDDAGNVYAATYSNGPATNVATNTEVDATALAVYVNPSDNHLLVDEGATVKDFDSTGTQTDSFATQNSDSRGVAVDGVSGTIYVANAGSGQVDVYAPPPPPAAPDVTVGRPVAVTDSSALLGGTIDPNRAATTYYVEYSTDPTFTGSVKVPASADADAGDGDSPVAVTKSVSGLAASTTYYVRVVAQNSVDTTTSSTLTFQTRAAATPQASDCPNSAFRIGESRDLPDCRAYEQVSPPDKNGGDIANLGSSQAASDGDGIAYDTVTPFGDALSNGFTSHLRSMRSADGWTTRVISPPLPDVPDTLTNGNTEHTSALRAITPDLSKALFQAVPAPPALPGTQVGVWNFYLTGPDLSLPYTLLNPPVPGNQTSAGYFTGQWEAVGRSEDLSHVVIEAGEDIGPLTPGAPAGRQLYEWVNGSLQLATILPGETPSPTGGFISGGHLGAKVNALSADGSRLWWLDGVNAGDHLFVRINGTSTRLVRTFTSSGDFVGATPSGNRAFFLDGTELYMYDFDSDTTTDIGAGDHTLGWSDDGSYVYYQTPGDETLKLWHEGATRTIGGPLPPHVGGVTEYNEEVTHNGRFALFIANSNLTAYDSNGHFEVYRYDATEDRLDCVSCSPDGRPATGDAGFDSHNNIFVSAQLDEHLNRQRRILENGTTFFETPDDLVASDRDQRHDVYEWSDGRLKLISTGRTEEGAFLTEVGPGGRDVFFITRDRLGPFDRDNNLDLYDARVNGGFAGPPATEALCSDESCHPAAGPAPPPPVAATVSFVGPGNSVGRRLERSTPARRAKVLTKLAHGKRFVIRIKVPAKGVLKVRGHGLKSSRRKLAKGGVHRVTVALTAVERRVLARHRAIRIRVRVTYLPQTGSPKSTIVRLKVKR